MVVLRNDEYLKYFALFMYSVSVFHSWSSDTILNEGNKGLCYVVYNIGTFIDISWWLLKYCNCNQKEISFFSTILYNRKNSPFLCTFSFLIWLLQILICKNLSSCFLLLCVSTGTRYFPQRQICTVVIYALSSFYYGISLFVCMHVRPSVCPSNHNQLAWDFGKILYLLTWAPLWLTVQSDWILFPKKLGVSKFRKLLQ